MDEPTNGLDIISKNQLRKVIAATATPDKTLLISSHQVKDLENLIDEVLILDGTTIALKDNLTHIARKLTFKISFNDDDLREALYAESVLKGNTIVTRNRDHGESHVDLELLYKATMADPARMHAVLTTN
jgi:ABC-2 type transport system ATP-binding protein